MDEGKKEEFFYTNRYLEAVTSATFSWKASPELREKTSINADTCKHPFGSASNPRPKETKKKKKTQWPL